MNLFETVKASVSVPDAAKMYGIEANRHGMALCPFHDDHHPSLKLNEDFFYCFGCGVNGDVIDLVARLYNLKPYEAAKKLAADFGIDPDKPPSVTALAKPRHPMIRAFREDERYCQRVLCDYLRLLEDWKRRYAPKNMDEEPDDRFEEACHIMRPRSRFLRNNDTSISLNPSKKTWWRVIITMSKGAARTSEDDQ